MMWIDWWRRVLGSPGKLVGFEEVLRGRLSSGRGRGLFSPNVGSGRRARHNSLIRYAQGRRPLIPIGCSRPLKIRLILSPIEVRVLLGPGNWREIADRGNQRVLRRKEMAGYFFSIRAWP